jgi:ABC-type proline/glycine betaine transport system permease subunit
VISIGVGTAVIALVAYAVLPVLAALIDGGGLGEGLFTGLTLNRPVISITFGVLVAALALLADWLGLLAETFLRPGGI